MHDNKTEFPLKIARPEWRYIPTMLRLWILGQICLFDAEFCG